MRLTISTAKQPRRNAPSREAFGVSEGSGKRLRFCLRSANHRALYIVTCKFSDFCPAKLSSTSHPAPMWSLFRSRLLAVPPPPVGSQRRCPGNMLAHDARRPHFIDVVWGARCEQFEKSPDFNQNLNCADRRKSSQASCLDANHLHHRTVLTLWFTTV
jgi:hypothetical protein